MPNWLTRLLSKQPQIQCKVLMLGLDAAGKTTFLYKLKHGEISTTIPTIGFNVETINCDGINFTVWDVGGCDKIRPLWRHYFSGTQVLLWMIDCNDRERFSESVEELQICLREDELKDAAILLLANKQDAYNAASLSQIQDAFEIFNIKDRSVGIIPMCTNTGEGIYEALNWIIEVTKKPPAHTELKVTVPKTQKTPANVTDVDVPKDCDEFIRDFGNGKIHLFNHRAHLRIAFLVLHRQHKARVEPRLAIEKFLDLLRQFYQNCDKARFKQSLHVTMTHFWCHCIQSAFPTIATEMTADENQLFQILLDKNPHLMNSKSWQEYYSREIIMNSITKTEFFPPDLQPLPSYVPISVC